jgi:hypothetical protein
MKSVRRIRSRWLGFAFLFAIGARWADSAAQRVSDEQCVLRNSVAMALVFLFVSYTIKASDFCFARRFELVRTVAHPDDFSL